MSMSNPEQQQQQQHQQLHGDDDGEESAATAMKLCPHCNKLVPEQNRILHTVLCQRQERQRQEHHAQQFSSFSTTQQQQQQQHGFSSEEDDAVAEEQIITNAVEQPPCPKDRNNNNTNGMDGILYAAAGSTTPNPSPTSEDATTTTSVPFCSNNNSNEIDDGGSMTQPIDLSSTPQQEEEEEEEEAAMEEEWSCPQCTLLNPISSSHCEACRFANNNSSRLEDAAATTTGHDLFDIRTPDATRRTRLIGNPNDDGEDADADAAWIDLIREGMRSTFANPASFTDHHHHRDTATTTTSDEEGIPLPNHSIPRNLIPGGALLGSFIGGSSAYLRGRSVGGGVMEGAMMGTVGGAVLNDFFGGNRTPTFTSPMADAAHVDREHHVHTSPPPRRIRVVRFQSSNHADNNHDDDDFMNRFDDVSRNNPDELLRRMLLPLVHNHHHHHHPRTNGMDIDNMNYEQLLELFGDGSSHNRGASPSTIRSLPVITLSDPMTELPEDKRNCSICLESFEKGDNRMMLPCMHGFHKGCIDRWLQQNGSCPVCKHVLSDSR
eukprot:CAMPEP_0195519636 /NCGR_PEP_ID=MMETSP0794_2-20130614/15178_1 /TAXON_ID=515487 /ORGANISM="Stephanopyxis turris, Strain CCMP 815" /LENGTH=547 /DNA_ID=CAMNT_0040648823 /DNA_START=181 /DNA_END=1824 /DNA_ORIENTATION=+